MSVDELSRPTGGTLRDADASVEGQTGAGMRSAGYRARRGAAAG